MFSDQRRKSLGILTIVVPTPQRELHLNVDFVESDIPLLIGLDTLDTHGLQFLCVENKLQSVKYGWNLPVTRQKGHVYVTWSEYFITMFSLIHIWKD
jgi:hypothetical protein